MLLLLFMNNCKESEEICYSCDPDINSWVIQNKEEIKNFDRIKIATFSHSYQKAIIGSLTPHGKKVLWQEKINHIMNLDLPEEELSYLKWYSEEFKKIDYSLGTSKELEKSFYERTIKGMKKFGWTRSFVYQTFFVLQDVDLTNTAESKIQQNDEGTECNCMYDLGCGWNGSCDERDDCNSMSDDDCGFFGGSDCEGNCI